MADDNLSDEQKRKDFHVERRLVHYLESHDTKSGKLAKIALMREDGVTYPEGLLDQYVIKINDGEV